MRPQRGQPRELLQAGIELIGAPAPAGTAEALTVLCRALDATGLADYKVGLGDASLFPALMESLDVHVPARASLLDALGRRDFAELEVLIGALGLPEEASALLLSVPQRRGAHEVLEQAPGPVADAVEGMRQVGAMLEPEVAGQGDLRPRPGALGSATTPARCSRSTTRRSGRRSGEGAAMTNCWDASGAHCRPWASRWESTTSTSRSPARSAGRGRSPDDRDKRSDDRGAPRGPVQRHGPTAGGAWEWTSRSCAATIASCSSQEIGVITMRPSDVPTYVEAGAADLEITGKDVLLEQTGLGDREAGARSMSS